MRKAAYRLIYRVLHYVYIIITVHSISLYSNYLQLFTVITIHISDERTCTVNTVPHSLRLITTELICSKYFLHVFVQNRGGNIFHQKTKKLL